MDDAAFLFPSAFLFPAAADDAAADDDDDADDDDGGGAREEEDAPCDPDETQNVTVDRAANAFYGSQAKKKSSKSLKKN